MPEFQPVAAAQVAAIKRPGCPMCQQNRMLLSKLEAGPSGFGRGTFECQKCGLIQIMPLSRGPMTPAARRWPPSEFRRPT
jgi:hypothetical protein